MVDEYQDTNRPQYHLIQRLRRASSQPGRRRRSRSVDLPLARRRPAQHPRLRARLPRSEDREARAELSIDAGHSRRGLGGHQPEQEPQGQAAVDRAQGRRPHQVLPRIGRARRSRLHHADGAFGHYVRARLHGRGAVSHQRSVARHRRLADALGSLVPHRRRRAVLRAQGNQGLARVPQAADQPTRRCQPAQGDQRAAARHRQGRDGCGRPRVCRRSAAAAARERHRGAGAELAVDEAEPRDRRAARAAARAHVAAHVPRSHRGSVGRRAERAAVDHAGQGARSDRVSAGSARRQVAKIRRGASKT